MEQKRILVTPLARKYASDKGIDLNAVQGSGPNGRIYLDDLKNYKGGSAGAETKRTLKAQTIDAQPIKVTPIRQAIANALSNSWNNVAYTALVNEVNMTSLWNQKKKITQEFLNKYGVKVTFTSFIVKATAIALLDFPVLNAKYDKSLNAIVPAKTINIGIAVDTPKGLLVPVIHNVEQKSLIDISRDIINLAQKARKGTLSPKEMQNGTFTITNYGTAGALFGVPVINYPELAILGTGAIIDKVYADNNGHFYLGKVMNLTCAADHKWIDGADIGRFISRIKELLENPLLLGEI